MTSKTTKTSQRQKTVSSHVHELVGDELYPLPLLLGQESRLKGVLAGVVPFAWKVMILLGLLLGARYLLWRWSYSLNADALVLATIVAVAESLAFVGVCLLFYNLWDRPKVKPASAPANWADCCWPENQAERTISVDLFVTTYNEPVEMLEETIASAQTLIYPYAIETKVWLLDDGNRAAVAALASRTQVGHLARATNEGFKAGNLENALRQTSADFFVICDADTKLTSNFLTRTLGYFRDRKIAWVQCPHWFTDTPAGFSIATLLNKFGHIGRSLSSLVPKFAQKIRFGKDPLQMDQHIFFVNIMSPRNRNNAAFCCGAASVHRRAALEDNLSRADDLAFVTKD
ncbi:glycosyltransferase, partial [Alphaproteobacteria bacterium]|nr:glycosyltransferase [Alphaproteobacteria bacterium]